MVEKILKETYISPKVELSQSEYNKLVDMARMKAKKIEEKAREIYEKEGIASIHFEGSITKRRYGELQSERFEFVCKPGEYCISPSDDFGGQHMFTIPMKEREKIAKMVGRYVEEVFVAKFGEHMYHLNEIIKIEDKDRRAHRTFIILTIVGWILAITMFVITLVK